jgi:hypothetical protein
MFYTVVLCYHGHQAILRNRGMCHYYDPPVKLRLDLFNMVCNGPSYFHLLMDVSLLYRPLKLRVYLIVTGRVGYPFPLDDP